MNDAGHEDECVVSYGRQVKERASPRMRWLARCCVSRQTVKTTHNTPEDQHVYHHITSPVTLSSSPSDIPLHLPHRRHISLPPVHHVKHIRNQENSAEHGDVPIHRLPIHRRRSREEAKDEERYQED